MTTSRNKILYSSKPTIGYYLLALFFPTMFFLVDDSRQLITENWDKSTNTYLLNSLALFMFFGIPILMFTLRREMVIYKDRVAIHKPTINSLRTYYFADLVKWNISDIYIYKAGRQVNLTLNFKNKKLTFNQIELTGFSSLIEILEKSYLDKKQ